MVRNLSSGGAMIVDTVAGVEVNTPVVLSVSGIQSSQSGVVKITEATEKLVEDLVNGRQRAA